MRQLFLFQKKNSGLIARNRLKLILVSDEMNCRPGIIDSIREDLARVLSRYAEFDPMAMDISLARPGYAGASDHVPVLSARIPIFYLHNTRNE
ncbi:MAG: cell division topological specificity factor MinE [Lachnospiraceae bacterium]|jgi:cell division topological specificity factor|nr:cell division topological specificity factor MinE [Lachnospiraceae bacterium]MCI8959140.1 cell division topological specificity factor MinE [Lachnospiraceae bacterium]